MYVYRQKVYIYIYEDYQKDLQTSVLPSTE